MPMRTSKGSTGWLHDSRGFSLAQMIFTLAIIIVLSGMAVFGFHASRSAFRLNNSARDFASHLERARMDAIRRHDGANVEFTSSTTYEITMDFANNGGRQTRLFNLENGVVLVKSDGTEMTSGPYPYADFDWRGRTTECTTVFRLKNTRNDLATVQVAGSGDITLNNSAGSLPNVNYTNVNQSADVVGSIVIKGDDTRLNLSPCNSSGAAGGGGGGGGIPPPTVTCNSTTLSLSDGLVSIRRNGASSSTVTATVSASGTVTVTPDPNLSVTPASRGFLSSGSGSFTITSVTRTRGTFPVKFNFSTCTPATLYVKVTN